MSEMNKTAANITAILTEFTYLDIQLSIFSGLTLEEIIERIENQYLDRLPAGAEKIMQKIKDAMNDPEIGEYLSSMKLVSQSHCEDKSLGLSGKGQAYGGDISCMNDLIQACAFQGPDGDLYVAYRGTGDGKWLDNGEGFVDASTDMQEAARRYFDYVYEQYAVDGKVYIGGHSKGGNEAQYVLMTSQYFQFIEGCYSLDGQGFSYEAIENFKADENYLKRLEKLFSINGAQDPVHNLIGVIALPENTYYVDCGELSLSEIANVHALEAILSGASLNWMSENDGHGVEGLLSIVSRQLNEVLMNDLSEHEKGHVAMAVMGLIELFAGKGYRLTGLDGAETTSIDYLVLLLAGAPAVLKKLLSTEEGRQLLIQFGTEAINGFLEKHIPGFATIRDKISAELDKRGIDTPQALWQYLKEAPVTNTLDLLQSILMDWDVLVALVKSTATVIIGTVLMKAAITLLQAAMTLLMPYLSIVAEILAVLLVVKLAIDFFKEHWDEIVKLAEAAKEFVQEKIAEMEAAMKLAISTMVNTAIAALLCEAEKIAEKFCALKDAVVDVMRELGSLVSKAIGSVVKISSPLLYTIIRTITGATRDPVTVDMTRLQYAVDRMDRLAARVQNVDRRLSGLYRKLCVNNIEQGEGVFTSLANMYNLYSADINVDEGNRIKRKATALSELFTDYSDAEKWMLGLLGG